MNTITRPIGLAHKAFALLALSALVIGLVPMQSFAQVNPSIDGPGEVLVENLPAPVIIECPTITTVEDGPVDPNCPPKEVCPLTPVDETVSSVCFPCYIGDNQVPAGSPCQIEVEVPGCMDPIAANYNPLATIDNGSCTYPPRTCEVTIVSNTSDYVVEKSANALALSYVHPGWTASIPGATWIWGDNPVVDPATASTQTFRKQFGFVGTVTNAKLYIAADNSYGSLLNTAPAGVSAAENNFQLATQDEYTVTSLIAQGNNELKIAVTNASGDANPANNPAGLLYKLVITGTPTTDSDCSVEYAAPVVVNGCTNPLATNYSARATPGNPQAANCDFNYASQCDENPNLLKNGSFEEPVIASSWALTTITDWVVTKVADNSSVLGEIWRGLSPSSQGAQHVELDSTEPTKLTQTVATVPGATYQLRFDLAARADSRENKVIATVDATTLVSTSTTNTNWTTYGGTFIADSATDVVLADATALDGYGTLVDNAVLCLVGLPDGGGDNDVDTYRLKGYVWHDDNENVTWDGIDDVQVDNEEDTLSGWTLNVTNGSTTLSTTTDATGYYYFEVPAGTWTITQVEEEGWDRTTQESYTITVPQPLESSTVSVLDTLIQFIIPTAYAAVIDVFGDFNFGNNEESSNGGGNGGGGTRTGDRNPAGDVLGISDTPTPLVLGEQVSAVPAGAPNTGKGGLGLTVIGQFLALPRRRNV